MNKIEDAVILDRVKATLEEAKQSPLWPELVKATRLTYSSRQKDDKRPYPKFSIPKGTFNPEFLGIEVTCPYCGAKNKLVRTRPLPDRLAIPSVGYPSFVCGQHKSFSCCRSKAASHITSAFESILTARVGD